MSAQTVTQHASHEFATQEPSGFLYISGSVTKSRRLLTIEIDATLAMSQRTKARIETVCRKIF